MNINIEYFGLGLCLYQGYELNYFRFFWVALKMVHNKNDFKFQKSPYLLSK